MFGKELAFIAKLRRCVLASFKESLPIRIDEKNERCPAVRADTDTVKPKFEIFDNNALVKLPAKAPILDSVSCSVSCLKKLTSDDIPGAVITIRN